MTIDISKPLSNDEGFPRIPNSLFRLYPLLDDFTVEITGFYGYLRSWRQNDRAHPLFGKSWLGTAEMEAQSGVSAYKIRKYTDILVKYGLLRVTKSGRVANKKIYEVLEPLTEAEFRAAYSGSISKFGGEIAKIEALKEEDRLRLAEKQREFPVPPPVDEKVIAYSASGNPVYF